MTELKVQLTHLENLLEEYESKIEEHESTLKELQESIWQKQIEILVFKNANLYEETDRIANEIAQIEKVQTEVNSNKLTKEKDIISAIRGLIFKIENEIDEDDDDE